MPRPQPGDYAQFFDRYVKLAQGDDVISCLQASRAPTVNFLSSLPADKADYAYASDKWTLAQLLQHVVDTERIFAYRALCTARGETTNLPGFDENSYALQAPAHHRTLNSIAHELIAVRDTSILLFESLTPEVLSNLGSVNHHPITTNAIGFMLVGHWVHHQNIITERYL